MRSIGLAAIALVVLCFAPVTPAFGVILHNDSEPTDKPNNDVVGRWGDNASCVAIAPNFIITTRHQGGGTGTSVVIGGNTYTIDQIWDHASADLRVVKLNSANLTNYVSLYTGTDETSKNFVLGGFGKSRGAELKTAGDVTYGYQWAGSDNQTQRWGTNTVDTVQSGYSGGTSYTSSVLQADFDQSGTDYEAAPSEWDSGGGWFIKVGSEWQLAALSAYVEHFGETWFRNATTGNPDPDQFRGIRISSYDNEWINGIIVPEPGTMILLTLGSIGLLRRCRKA